MVLTLSLLPVDPVSFCSLFSQCSSCNLTRFNGSESFLHFLVIFNLPVGHAQNLWTRSPFYRLSSHIVVACVHLSFLEALFVCVFEFRTFLFQSIWYISYSQVPIKHHLPI